MSTPTTQPTFINTTYETVYKTVGGFWSGWLGGTTVLAAGKLWTLVFSPAKTTTELLGHIGTPLFRRELAVGLAVYALSSTLFALIGDKLSLNPNTLSGRVYTVLTHAISIALASAAAASITSFSYQCMFYTAVALGVAILAKEIYFFVKDSFLLKSNTTPPLNNNNSKHVEVYA